MSGEPVNEQAPDAPRQRGVMTTDRDPLGGVFLAELAATRDVALAVIEAPDGLRFVGSAKRHPDDDPDEAVGCTLAVARAARAFADHYAALSARLVADAADARDRRVLAAWAARSRPRDRDAVAELRGALEHAVVALHEMDKGGPLDPHVLGRARAALDVPSHRVDSSPASGRSVLGGGTVWFRPGVITG